MMLLDTDIVINTTGRERPFQELLPFIISQIETTPHDYLIHTERLHEILYAFPKCGLSKPGLRIWHNSRAIP